MQRVLVAIAFFVISSSAFSTSFAGCLPMATAPQAFPNPKPWGYDAGVVTSTFLQLRDAHGIYRALPGVDVSHYNLVDYDKLKACGAAFAIVKMDALFQDHLKAFSDRQIPVIPYYYLAVPANLKDANAYASDATLPSQIAEAENLGAASARDFIARYRNHMPNGNAISFGGSTWTVAAVDVEEQLKVPKRRSGAATAAESNRYGEMYSAMVAAWVRTVEDAIPDVIVIFYTNPSIYTQYLIQARSEDFKIFRGLPVWLANYRPDGGEVSWNVSRENFAQRKGAQRLCLSAPGGNKCVLDQYTARGIVGVPDRKVAGYPMHIDLDRFYSVQKLSDADGTQFLRDLDYVQEP